MIIRFETCERPRALEFLKKLFPSRDVSDTPESAARVLDYVERDVIRIPDPDMHGMSVGIFPSKNWTPEIAEEVVAALKKFQEGLK